MEKRVQAGKTIMERRGWCIDPAICAGDSADSAWTPLLGGPKSRIFIPGYPFRGYFDDL